MSRKASIHVCVPLDEVAAILAAHFEEEFDAQVDGISVHSHASEVVLLNYDEEGNGKATFGTKTHLFKKVEF